jgi:hypothetical protein
MRKETRNSIKGKSLAGNNFEAQRIYATQQSRANSMVGKPQRSSFKNFTDISQAAWNATGDAQDLLLSQYKSVQQPGHGPHGLNVMRRSV